MGAPEQLRNTTQLFKFLELLASSETLNEVLQTVQNYLNAWDRERISDLQNTSIVRLQRFRDAVRRQCHALKQAGLQPTPEIIELDEFLFIAVQLADCMKTHPSKASSAASGPNSWLLRLR
jgi:hypothetical protein